MVIQGEKMKSKRIIFITVLAVCLITLTGCDNNDISTQTSGNSNAGVRVIEVSPENQSDSNDISKVEQSNNSDETSAGLETDAEHEKIAVPNVLNVNSSKAKSTLENNGFKVSIVESHNSDVQKDMVFVQSPNPGELLEKGSSVTIIVSLGKENDTSSEPSTVSKLEESSKSSAPSKEEKKPTSSELNAAYREVVDRLVKKYGKPHINQSYYSGVAVIKQIDFDKDGIDELYCAYSQDLFYPDMQEIYGYKDGTAVSLFKGKTSNTGTGVDPFIEIAELDGKYYILSEGAYKENYTFEKWIGVKNNSSFLLDSMDDTKKKSTRTYFALGDHKEVNFIDDTRNIMKQLGCDYSGIIDFNEYYRQTSIYWDYIKSNEWRSFSREIGPRVEELDRTQTIFYDFDGDGVLEMWFKASNGKSSGWPETLSLFCTIKNGRVEQLLKSGECGGELGGDYVTLTYSEDDNKLRIGNFYHARGFGGVSGSLTSYDYSNSTLKKYLEYSGTSYNDQPSKNTINGKSVSEEEYRDFTQKYHNLSFDNAQNLLFYTPPTTSIKDRLKEMKVIT